MPKLSHCGVASFVDSTDCANKTGRLLKSTKEIDLRICVTLGLLVISYGCGQVDKPVQTVAANAALASVPAPIPVKVVIVTMFERGADEGDEPGEFQFWKERRDLDRHRRTMVPLAGKSTGFGLARVVVGCGHFRAS